MLTPCLVCDWLEVNVLYVYLFGKTINGALAVICHSENELCCVIRIFSHSWLLMKTFCSLALIIYFVACVITIKIIAYVIMCISAGNLGLLAFNFPSKCHTKLFVKQLCISRQIELKQTSELPDLL